MQNKVREPFLCLLGTFASFLVFLTAFPIFNVPIFCGIAAILAALFLFLSKTRIRKWLPLLSLAVALLLLLTINTALMDGINGLYNQITQIYHNFSNYVFESYTLSIPQEQLPSITMRLMLVLFLIELPLQYLFLVRWHKSFASFAISFALYFPTLLYNTPQPWIFTGLLYIFWALLFFTSNVRRKSRRSQAYGKPFVYATLCIAITMVSVLTLIPQDAYIVSESSTSMRQKLLQAIDQFTYNLLYGSQDVGEIDLGRAGNRVYTGALQMEVTHSDPKRLYLRTYSGALYDGFSWKSLDLEQYRKAKDVRWEDIRLWMNQTSTVEDNPPASISVKDMRVDQQYAILPYYLHNSSKDLQIFYDGYAKWNREKDVQFHVWDREMETRLPQGKSYSAYMDFVKANYLQLSDDVRAAFNRQEDLRNKEYMLEDTEIIDYVKTYLYSHTTYTLYPGRPPHNEDFVSYFLWENQQGYCVHYASAATLLLRYYGIPARYVEGYRVDAQQYHDGTAKVKDSDAHSWVEIFDETYGWVPIEVTPANDDETSPQTPQTTVNANTNTQNTNTDVGDTPTDNTKTTTKQQLIEDVGTTNSETEAVSLQFLWKVLVILLVPLLVIGQALLRHQARLRKLHDADARKAMGAMYGWLEDLCAYGAVIEDTITQVVEKAKFSQHDVTDEELRFVEETLFQQRREVLAKLSLWKKCKLYLWDAL